MKKTFLLLITLVAAALTGRAEDMTDVWNSIKAHDGFIVADVQPEKASKNGFETLTVALNSSPTAEQINAVKHLAAAIEPNQKITSVSQEGVDVAVYAAPATADGSEYKVMFVIDKNDNADKSLIVLYGICTRNGVVTALQSMSLEDIIGG